MNLRGKRILVTGGRGFVGRRLCLLLEGLGAEVLEPAHGELDLEDPASAERLAAPAPHVLIHLAAHFGGVGYVSAHADEVGRRNSAILRTVQAAVRIRAPEVVAAAGSACQYSAGHTEPMPEEWLDAGPPHPSVREFAEVKRATHAWIRDLNESGVARGLLPVFTTIYGPGDRYDDPARAHVVGALCGKFARAVATGVREIEVWGDGSAVRDLLHVDDAAHGVVRLIAVGMTGPVNLGAGEGVSIRQLVYKLATISGFTGRVAWGGGVAAEPVKILDVRRARACGWAPRVPLDDGLRAAYAEALTQVRR